MAFIPAMPHGPVHEVFDDVFMVTGGFRIGPGVSISRNMTIVRHDGELTVVNSVRLTAEGEEALDKLGKVATLLRIGALHGADDPYYMDRYKPVLWAPARTKHMGDLETGQELKPWSAPIPGVKAFVFERAKKPEAAMLVERNGGVLVSCDSYQNWTTLEDCSFLARMMMKVMGFGPTVIGGPWAKAMGPDVRHDFDRLAEQSFKHLIPGHGTLIKNEAVAGLRKAMNHRFP